VVALLFYICTPKYKSLSKLHKIAFQTSIREKIHGGAPLFDFWNGLQSHWQTFNQKLNPIISKKKETQRILVFWNS